MSMTSINFQYIAEYDPSPLIVFDSKGHILYANNSAEILLGYADSKELFSISMQYAPATFGSKTTTVDIHFSHLRFYAVNVCYENEEWIAIRLYYRPRNVENRKLNKDSFIDTDINLLLDASIAMFNSEYSGRVTLMTDRDMPSFKLNQNNFSKLIRKILESFIECKRVDISLMMGIGEAIIIEDEKFQVVKIKFKSDCRDIGEDIKIDYLCSLMNIVPLFEDDVIIIDVPFIK